MSNIEVLYKSDNALVIYKPAGIPSQPDPSGDKDAMTLASEHLMSLGERSNLWLIHRLDRNVSGVMVFARNKRTAAELSEIVKVRLLTKKYVAIVEGDAEGGEFCDLLYKDSRVSKAFVVDRNREGVKEARLSYRKIATADTPRGKRTLISVLLETGRVHQIRAQLSHRHNPILGDGKYGSREKLAQGLALSACNLEIELSSEKISVTRLPDTTEHPWSIFAREDYERV